MTKPFPIALVLQGFLIVLLGSVAAWMFMGFPHTGIDDADIFLVYARHVADGHGFVYNIGGEPVEGFTSLLWTLICSGFSWFGSSVEKPLYVLNLLLGTYAVVSCLKRTEHPTVFMLLLASSPAWFAWCQVTLMETGLWCLLVTLLGLALMERNLRALCILLPLMVLTRPESMLWGAWVVVLFASDGGGLKRAWLPALVVGLSVALLVSFRMWYFGYPVPNTYYAKVSPDRLSNLVHGFGYLSIYLINGIGVLFALTCWGFTLLRKERRAEFMLALFLLPGIGIPVLVGGDHFGGFRFYQPIWPLLCLLAARRWPLIASRWKHRKGRALLYGFCAFGWVLFPFTAHLRHEFRIAREGRQNGETLVRMFQDTEVWPTVAVITAGGNKLGYPGHVYDLMGLNSTEMAHAQGEGVHFKNHTGFNREVFYRWHPDILLCGDSYTFDSLVLNGLHEDPRFNAQYVKCTLHRNGTKLEAYYSNRFLMALPSRQ